MKGRLKKFSLNEIVRLDSSLKLDNQEEFRLPDSDRADAHLSAWRSIKREKSTTA